MRLLVLGGTEFVGRALVEEGLRRDWQVTVFHRGRHAPPPGVTVLHGDRTAAGGLTALEQGEWDLVADTWSLAPSAVRDTARLLAGRAGRYVYVSSRSVYPMPTTAGLTEAAATVDASPEAGETTYEADKRGGELAAEAAFGDRALYVRPGLILGPWENIGRLPWWLERVARGGQVLAPGPEDLPLQYVDARDLAAWTLDAAARGLGGPYDVVSPSGHTTMGGLLRTCVAVTGSDAALRWVDPQTLLAAGVQPFTELPIWVPPGEYHDSVHRSDVSKALAAGLRCRPVAETVADTWDWVRREGAPPPHPLAPTVGLSPEAEAEVLRRATAGG